jgi:hypothetical protein
MKAAGIITAGREASQEHRQDSQDFSGFDLMRKILRNPVNPVCVY